MNVSTSTKAINSKRLFMEINDVVKDGLYTVDLNWSIEEEREVFIDFLNSLLHEFWAKGDVEQWKVQCNSLNNNIENIMDGKFILDIYFRQKHCLNTSRIRYTILE